MKFRTEIEIPRNKVLDIDHSSILLMLGSCFTDNIGEQLSFDGFDVVHNPMGPLYNPLSILRAINLVNSPDRFTPTYSSLDNVWHCLDFASRYSAYSLSALKQIVESDLESLRTRLSESDTVFITLGTAFVFTMDGAVVGNCHKFPATTFLRRKLSIEECIDAITLIVDALGSNKRVIFTISPIRHVADTLHGNQVSKATLLTSLHLVMETHPDVYYFPSYEIMLDDLRDYRFYGADFKHPSETAINYIYEVFGKFYFSNQTIEKARVCRKQSKRQSHIPLSYHATQSL